MKQSGGGDLRERIMSERDPSLWSWFIDDDRFRFV